MIKMQAPQNLTEFRLEGQKIEFADGLVDIEERHLEHFLAHGFAQLCVDQAEQKDASGAAPRHDARAERE
jgi:hypothetical protein